MTINVKYFTRFSCTRTKDGRAGKRRLRRSQSTGWALREDRGRALPPQAVGGRHTVRRLASVFSAAEGRGGGREKASLPADRHLLDKAVSTRGGTTLTERLAEGQRPCWAAFGPASVPEKEAPRWPFVSSTLCNLTLIRCRSTFFPSRTCVGRRRVCVS